MKQAVQALLNRAGYRIEGIRHTPRQLLDPARRRAVEFEDVICRRMFEVGQALTFIQVGAYDGVSTDPIHKYISRCGWRGVMLEPQRKPASALRRLYADAPEITVLEAAVDRERGARTLYTLMGAIPTWAGGMASFDRQHLLKHDYVVPGIEAMIHEVEVPCITFGDVLTKLPGDRLDLLQIDAEGADAHLLSLFPFATIKPAIVHWESKNLSRADQELALSLLVGQGYVVARSGDEDMLATLA